MKLHRLISYTLMTAGAVVASASLLKRRQWEQSNIYAAIMLDWDDVQAVATRAGGGPPDDESVASLLRHYREHGATHLSIPELSIDRLLTKGQLSVTQGSSTHRLYLQAQSAALADWVAAELQSRLPHLDARRGKGNIISFNGDLPSVGEVGLGFDPAHAELARQARLEPVARPIGYSWVQPAMIDRTFDQAAALGCRIVAVQGTLIPGHEFKIQHTVEAMQRNQLTYAYFSQSRHQKGDWFLAKHLAPRGLVILSHELTPLELLDEDWHTASYRWATLAVEAGIRLCSVRFFKILHAADPLESVAYVDTLAGALRRAGLTPTTAAPVNLSPLQPRQNKLSLACVGVSAAGAAGLAADLLPLPDHLKLMGVAAGAAALAGLPFAGNIPLGQGQHHHHDHDHHHHHDDSDHHHHHDDDHHHDHDHGPAPAATAYAQKGLALAATVAFPAAAAALGRTEPLEALAHSAAVTAAGAAAVAATTIDTDYLLGIEEYRGYNLDWLLPLGVAAGSALLSRKSTPARRWTLPFIRPKPEPDVQNSTFGRLALGGVAVAALASLAGQLPPDLPANLDREHRHAHTHHLSVFQQQVGDLKLALSPRPLRKWALLAPLGALGAALFSQRGQSALATAALLAGTAGQVAALAGFRHGQRPLQKTAQDRARSWLIGAALAGGVWFISAMLGSKRR